MGGKIADVLFRWRYRAARFYAADAADEAMALLRRLRPHLRSARYSRTSAFNNCVLMVESEPPLVFKLASTPFQAEGIERMAAALRLLTDSELAPVVPQLDEARIGEPAIIAYRKLPGVAVEFAALSAESRAALARDLGNFLAILHRLPPPWHRSPPLPHRHPHAVRGWLAYGRGLAIADETARSTIGAFDLILDGLDENGRQWPIGQPTGLIHGDIKEGNILVDPNSGRLTGVLDFALAALGDPRSDFRWLNLDSPEFCEEIIVQYRQAGGEPPDSATLAWTTLEAACERLMFALLSPDRAFVASATEQILGLAAALPKRPG